ncbi:MAG TPA: BMP family ABC transporter substrate-binding protein [Syntrophobacteraceae bacterium]|nr:BMP family ABC transporter substrate-binding protein [Syntrophobacteraceae bacterium]
MHLKSLVTGFILVCVLLGPNAAGAESLKVIVLTDAAGLGDRGFNDVCWQGVLRAKKDFGIDAQFLQSREQADYASNLALAAGRADIVVTLGYLFTDSLKEAAPHFPKTRFIHIEGDVRAENVASIDFRSEEGGFIAGLTAGLFTRKMMVGVVAGMDIPPVEAYVSGFRAGVQTAQKARGEKIETIVASAGSFNDPVKGKSLAAAMMDRGTDVIFRAAGNTGIGVTEAVKETSGMYMIAEDLDQDAEIPGRVLASALKRMDVAVYDAIRGVVEGRFRAGHRWLGVSEGAIDITEMKYSRQLFSPVDLERIERAKDLLKSSRLSVPKRYTEVDSFVAPSL